MVWVDPSGSGSDSFFRIVWLLTTSPVVVTMMSSLLVLLLLSGVNETRREDGHTMARGMGSPASLPVGVFINAGAEADLDGEAAVVSHFALLVMSSSPFFLRACRR